MESDMDIVALTLNRKRLDAHLRKLKAGESFDPSPLNLIDDALLRLRCQTGDVLTASQKLFLRVVVHIIVVMGYRIELIFARISESKYTSLIHQMYHQYVTKCLPSIPTDLLFTHILRRLSGRCFRERSLEDLLKDPTGITISIEEAAVKHALACAFPSPSEKKTNNKSAPTQIGGEKSDSAAFHARKERDSALRHFLSDPRHVYEHRLRNLRRDLVLELGIYLFARKDDKKRASRCFEVVRGIDKEYANLHTRVKYTLRRDIAPSTPTLITHILRALSGTQTSTSGTQFSGGHVSLSGGHVSLSGEESNQRRLEEKTIAAFEKLCAEDKIAQDSRTAPMEIAQNAPTIEMEIGLQAVSIGNNEAKIDKSHEKIDPSHEKIDTSHEKMDTSHENKEISEKEGQKVEAVEKVLGISRKARKRPRTYSQRTQRTPATPGHVFSVAENILKFKNISDFEEIERKYAGGTGQGRDKRGAGQGRDRDKGLGEAMERLWSVARHRKERGETMVFDDQAWSDVETALSDAKIYYRPNPSNFFESLKQTHRHPPSKNPQEERKKSKRDEPTPPNPSIICDITGLILEAKQLRKGLHVLSSSLPRPPQSAHTDPRWWSTIVSQGVLCLANFGPKGFAGANEDQQFKVITLGRLLVTPSFVTAICRLANGSKRRNVPLGAILVPKRLVLPYILRLASSFLAQGVPEIRREVKLPLNIFRSQWTHMHRPKLCGDLRSVRRPRIASTPEGVKLIFQLVEALASLRVGNTVSYVHKSPFRSASERNLTYDMVTLGVLQACNQRPTQALVAFARAIIFWYSQEDDFAKAATIGGGVPGERSGSSNTGEVKNAVSVLSLPDFIKDERLLLTLVCCLTQAGEHVSAAVFCQFFDPVLSKLGLRALDKASERDSDMYQFLFELPLLEFAVSRHHRLGQTQARDRAVNAMQNVILNIHNSNSMRAAGLWRVKVNFVQTLAERILSKYH